MEAKMCNTLLNIISMLIVKNQISTTLLEMKLVLTVYLLVLWCIELTNH